MSILVQPKYPQRSQHHLPIFHTPLNRRPATVTAASTTTTTKSTATKHIIQPRLVTPPTAVTATGPPVLDDPSLQSTWSHRALVASGCTTVLISLAKSILAASDSHTWLQSILAGLVGYILADLGSGVYHWAIDNYGSASTPIFGAQIEAFQGHHKWPWTITRRQFANNLHTLAKLVTLVVLPIDLVCDSAVVLGYVGTCSGCIMFSQQFHAWAHGTKSRLPPLVVALQDLGLLVSRSQHAAHHRPPYNNNYCIVSGVWNEFLDKQKVFEVLEMVFFFKFGLRPRSWSDPSSEWIQETETLSQIRGH